jgi:aspartyl-tRNA(Asn)/glutamyl-tRNA(Gln) amidotransferase subunit A
VGPIASTTADVRLMLDAMAGFDPLDPYSVEPPTRDGWDGRPLRIALPIELAEWNLDPEVSGMLEDVVQVFIRDGHSVERVSLPILRESIGLGPAVLGIVESGAIIEDRLDEVTGVMMEAVRRSDAISARTLARANHRIASMRREVHRAFDRYDLMITPTLPCRVPEAASAEREMVIEVGGVKESRTSALTRLVNPWNLAAVPAGSLPVTMDSGDAPISVQVVGPAFSDWKVLDAMEFLEAAVGGPWDTVASAD